MARQPTADARLGLRRRGAAARAGGVLASPVVIAVLVVIHSLLSVLLIIFVLMHSGKDAGLSGAFGVGGSGGAHGGSSAIVERNLTRITVVVAALFFISTYVLGKAL